MAQLLDGLHIVLVDDDEDSRFVAQHIMQYQGGFILALPDAKAALTILQHMRPDVLVSDINMPDVDGYGLLKEARERGLLDGVPTLALTALSSPEDRRRMLAAGFNEVMVKPFDPNALCSIVQALARRREPPGA